MWVYSPEKTLADCFKYRNKIGLNDDTLGRVLDRLSDAGTNTVLGSVAIKVMKSFDLDLSHVHHDTTSHKVYGEYGLYEWEDHDQPFVITHGFSKDHRPDLK